MRSVIRSERVVTPEGVGPAAIHIEDGTIVAVGPDLPPPAEEHAELDAGDLVVMPGGVDVHTHMELTVGGVRTADDWETGSWAALHGGTTTVVDFAEPGPDGSLLTGLATAEALIRGRSVVDAGLHMTVTEASDARLREMEAVVQAGQTTFKVYTAYPAYRLEDADLERVFARAAELDGRVWVHCEDGPAIDAHIRDALQAGRRSALEHARTRPPETEADAVAQVIRIAERTGAAVHLAHLSTREAVAHLAAARAAGLPITAETCPHYLWLEEHRLGWQAPAGLCHICAPPLRTAPHLEALWQALADGVIDAVGTDHCPFNLEGGKDRGWVDGAEDFTRTPGGLPGVESRLPLVYAGGVAAERFGLQRFVECVSSGPARVAGLYPKKGVLQPGADADLVLFDPEVGTSLDASALHMNVDHSPYEGLRVVGCVAGVIKGGRLVLADGQPVEPPPPGAVLSRRPAAAFGTADPLQDKEPNHG